MKILIVSSRFPYPLGKADSRTVYHMIEYLSQRHELYLITFFEQDSSHNELKFLEDIGEKCQRVELVPFSKWKSTLKAAAGLFSKTPLQTHYFYYRTMQKKVNDLIEKYSPDLLYAHLIRTGEYIKDYADSPKVLAMQVSQTLNYDRMIRYAKSLKTKLIYSIEYNKIKKYEPEITRFFSKCLLISKYDKEAIEGSDGVNNIFFNPHGIDVNYYVPDRTIEKERNSIIFNGVMETPTNIDAISYFYEDIYPLIKKEVPDVKLYIVGMNPTKKIISYSNDPTVTVTGFVDDIRPYLNRAQVGISPLRIGAGLQNKVLVSMSMGLPVVCTAVANEGIGAEQGRSIIIADTARGFADWIVRLFKDSELRNSIGENARRFVQDYWTWEYHFKNLENLFEELVLLEDKKVDDIKLSTEPGKVSGVKFI